MDDYVRRDECSYVKKEECALYRKEDNKVTDDLKTQVTVIQTKLAFFEKIMWMILTVLITGFAGVIFAVLSK